MEKKSATKKPVLILDIHRGVYFGYLVETRYNERTVVLENARQAFSFMCLGKDGEKGVYALATSGPQDGSKISPRINMIVHDVAKIIDCTDVAIQAWEKQIWK